MLDSVSNPEKNVATSARLCYSEKGAKRLREDMSEKEIKKLVNKIADLGHGSTMEHTFFYFYIVCSRVTSHQIVRHRIASYSQRSQRYVSEDDFTYIVPPKIKANKKAYKKFKQKMRKAQKDYNEMLEMGIPKEDARYLLPQIRTSLVASFNARSLMNFFELRCCTRAQWEVRSIANQMLSAVKDIAPTLFENAGPSCVSKGFCPEGEMSCGRIDKIKNNSYSESISTSQKPE